MRNVSFVRWMFTNRNGWSLTHLLSNGSKTVCGKALNAPTHYATVKANTGHFNCAACKRATKQIGGAA